MSVLQPSSDARATALSIAALMTSGDHFIRAVVDSLPEAQRKDHIAVAFKRAEILGQMVDRMLGAEGGPNSTEPVRLTP